VDQIPLHYFMDQQAVAYLDAMVRKGIVPHALLFSGIDGVGKKAVALAMAMALNCDGSASSPDAKPTIGTVHACGCRPCQKIRSGMHPDVYMIEPDGPALKIDQIRRISARFAMMPYEARTRVAVLHQAHAMTNEAANAFLKLLEEPPARSVLILTARRPSDLLQTIVSRCLIIRFSPVSESAIAHYLRQEARLAEDEAHEMAILAGGSFARILSADTSLSPREWVRLRRWLLDECAALSRKDSAPPPEAVLAFCERLTRYKAVVDDILEIMKSWIRDLSLCRSGGRRVLNSDRIDALRAVSAGWAIAELLHQFDAIEQAQRRIAANANLRLTLESLMLKWVYRCHA